MKKFKIEVRNIGFKNKGAELMCLSILNNMDAKKSVFCIEPSHENGSQPYSKYTLLGMQPLAAVWRRGINITFFLDWLPNKILEMFGMVREKDLDLILDASGFSYSDKWGTNRLRELVQKIKRAKKFQTKFVFMPQAFGPFTKKEDKKLIKFAVENASLVFARDVDSKKYLEDIGINKEILLCPDFTCDIDALHRKNTEIVAIVPNARMVDKGKIQQKSYLEQLETLAKALHKYDVNFFFLVHEGIEDFKIAKLVKQRTKLNFDILTPKDSLEAKSIIKSCKYIFSSRYHASVSALSNLIPAFSTGWSHKYKRLHEDYNFLHGYIEQFDPSAIKKIIIENKDLQKYSALQSQIKAGRKNVQDTVNLMWNKINKLLIK